MVNCLIVGVELGKTKNLKFFSHKKLKNSYRITDTSLYPSNVTMLSRRFVQAYSLQLEDIIYNNKETINMNDLIPLLVLIEKIIENNYPIYLEHNLSRKYSEMTLKVLTEFIRENFDTLKFMYKNLTNKIID